MNRIPLILVVMLIVLAVVIFVYSFRYRGRFGHIHFKAMLGVPYGIFAIFEGIYGKYDSVFSFFLIALGLIALVGGGYILITSNKK